MLLTLATRSLATLLAPDAKLPEGQEPLSLPDLPQYAIQHLELRGLNVPASMLSGWSLPDLDGLRDRADKAGCPCLVLIEDTPLDFNEPDEAADRVHRLAVAAHRLGCNALAISFAGPDDDATFDRVATDVKTLMPHVERMELNLLIAPNEGLTQQPDRLTDLIKRIGGFRIGSLPSFGHASTTKDPIGTLRKLAPYAGAVHASVQAFTRAGKHKGYDLAECVKAIRSVGFVNTLAIDYLGNSDPAANIKRAREVLQAAIDADQ